MGAVLFGPDQEYEKVVFDLFLDRTIVSVTRIGVYSQDVRIEGDYTLAMERNDVSVSLKMSLSPEKAAMFKDSMMENFLSPDENGWYSAIIDYKGNALLLKAFFG